MEEEKALADHGRYLPPAEHGQPKELAIGPVADLPRPPRVSVIGASAGGVAQRVRAAWFAAASSWTEEAPIEQ